MRISTWVPCCFAIACETTDTSTGPAPWGSVPPDTASLQGNADDWPYTEAGSCEGAYANVTLDPDEIVLQRFTPSAWPYDLMSTSIFQYEDASAGCGLDAALEPGLIVTDPTSDPDADPTFWDAAATSYPPTPAVQYSTLLLDEPLRLEEGESVFLSFRAPETTNLACVLACDQGAPSAAGAQYVAETLDPPFDWIDLETLVTMPLLTIVVGAP